MDKGNTEIEQMQAIRYCVFACRGEAFAFPALSIRNVTPRCELSPMPLSHSSLAGLAYLHKEFVPVFDLQEWIATDKTMAETGQQTLFLNSDCGPWGLLIDQVLGLEPIEVSFNGAPSPELKWTNVNIGSATFQERFVSILDGELLFDLLNQQLTDQWHGLNDECSDAGQSSDPAAESLASLG